MPPPLYRSGLYVPCDHARAMAKAVSLHADLIIFDLEDGVAPEQKATGRHHLAEWFNTYAGQRRQHVHYLLRVNHHNTLDYEQDLALAQDLPLDGLMLSKTGGKNDIDRIIAALSQANRGDLPIWCNIETPRGVCHAQAIAAHPHVSGMVVGTNDLANDLRVRRTPERTELMYCLQAVLTAARAFRRPVLDGTYVALEDEAGLRAEAEQGRMLGFDGKTLIHPKQIPVANAVFGPTPADIAEAEAIIAAYEQAMQEGKAVTLLNGRMIERLHYERAQETLAIAEAA